MRRLGLHLRVADGIEVPVWDRGQIRLVEVVVFVLQERRLLVRVLGVVLDDELGGVELFFAVDLKLLVHVGEALVLFLDAAELTAACLSPLREGVLRVGERDHQVEQVLLREAVAVGRLVDAGLVGLTGAQPEQDLIVTEVARRVQVEILVAILGGETERDLSVEDEVQLAEVLLALDDGLVRNEDAAVES